MIRPVIIDDDCDFCEMVADCLQLGGISRNKKSCRNAGSDIGPHGLEVHHPGFNLQNYATVA